MYIITDLILNEKYYGSRTSKKQDIIEDFWSYVLQVKERKMY